MKIQLSLFLKRWLRLEKQKKFVKEIGKDEKNEWS